MKERCLIFGGGGFIGSHLCENLFYEGYDVVLFDKINFSRKNISHLENKLTIIEGDFNNGIDIKTSLSKIDYVFHLVSSTLPATSNVNPEYDVETNLISSLKLLKECVNKNIKKIVFLSSGGTVYGIPEEVPIKESYFSNPICSYGIIKKAIEEYLNLYNRIYGLDYTVFRLSNPYGERQNPHLTQGAIAVFINKVIQNEPIEIWGNGEITRDYIYIKDVVNVLTKSLKIDTGHKIFNLSTGTGYSLNQIIEIIKKVSGKQVKLIFKDARSIDVPVNILDNELIKRSFNWKPEVSIEEGISKTYKFIHK